MEEHENMLEADDGLETLCETLLPLWHEHIESARLQTNQAIEDLSSRFASLSHNIHNLTTKQGQQQSEDLLKLLSDSQRDLATVINLLKESFDEKKLLVAAISELTVNAKSLSNMAGIVTRIAKETGMVAVNAAIEAARVGDRGRGFAVVADAVKRLSTDAANTGNHISDTVDEVIKAIKKVENLSSEFDKRDSEIMENAEEIVSHVVSDFGDMAKQVVSSNNQMLDESRHVGAEIDQVLVSLQFQDRVSQMLTQVNLNIDKLGSVISNGEVIEDINEWLDAFKSTYVMQEQYQIHSGRHKRMVAAPKTFKNTVKKNEPDLGEITFF